jgi:hypothetical protein
MKLMKANVSHTVKLLLFISCLVLLCAALTVSSETQTNSSAGQANDKKEDFTDDDLKVEKVPGKWMLMTSVDLRQGQDPSAPVILVAVKTVYGQGKYLGRVKVPQVKIENRSQKILQSVQIRWTIAHKDEPDVVLLEGVMPSTDARIEPFNPPTVVNIPHVYFNKVVKPLLKEGELSGHILLTLGIQEARFVDGTEWHISRQVAFLKTTLMLTETSPSGRRRPSMSRQVNVLSKDGG